MKGKGNKFKESKSAKKNKACATMHSYTVCDENGNVVPAYVRVAQTLSKGSVINGYFPFHEHQPVSINGLNPTIDYGANFWANPNLGSTAFFNGAKSTCLPKIIYHPNHPDYQNALYPKSVSPSILTFQLLAQSFHNANLLATKIAPITTSSYSSAANNVCSVLGNIGFNHSNLHSYRPNASSLRDNYTNQIFGMPKLGEGLIALTNKLTSYDGFYNESISGISSSLIASSEYLKAISLTSEIGLWSGRYELLDGIVQKIQGSLLNPEKYLSPLTSLQNLYGNTLNPELLSRSAINSYAGSLADTFTAQPFSILNKIGGMHEKFNDFTAPYASVNDRGELQNNLRWRPEEYGGFWDTDYATPKKQEDTEVQQLRAEVADLNKQVKHLKLGLKKMGERYICLIESKLQTVEENVQLALAVPKTENLVSLEEHHPEDLIDKYGVMKLLNISESTYYRHKSILPTYQIGSKKLFKASEIRAHIKQFLK